MPEIPASVRRQVAERYGMRPGLDTTLRCHYCPETTVARWPLGSRGLPTYWPLFGPGFGLDHVFPRSKGGRHVADNLVLACRSCNTRKLDRVRTDSAVVPGRGAE